jgi:hypothetical protein
MHTSSKALVIVGLTKERREEREHRTQQAECLPRDSLHGLQIMMSIVTGILVTTLSLNYSDLLRTSEKKPFNILASLLKRSGFQVYTLTLYLNKH